VVVKIWLPEGYSKTERYPVIYEFVYDHTNFIANTASRLYEIPKCIVVYTGIRTGNEHYSSPNLNEKGRKFYGFLKDELIPLIEKEYSASNFRVAAGLSQGADYANYIFRNNPELFSGFLIFAIESPNYKLDYSQYAGKLPRPVDYFIAIANDEPERIEHAKSLSEQLGKSDKVNVQMYHYERAEHTYVMLHALPDALNFLFRDFINFRRPKNENPSEYFKNLLGELKNKYGTEPHLGLFIVNYLNVLKETKDATNVLQLVNDLEPRLSELNLFNFGYTLAGIGQFEAAEKILKMSAQKTPNINFRVNPVMVYRTLALNIYDKRGETALAFQTLKDGHEKIKSADVALLYYIGNYAVNKKYRIEDGIEALISFQNNREKSSMSGSFSVDSVDVIIAKGYLLLDKKKEAKVYLNKASKENPNNAEVDKLLKEVGQN
jgi:predicted alpha/beta superfamily hydrolase